MNKDEITPTKVASQGQKYMGWKNYETYNVMLCINGTYGLCKELEYLRELYKQRNKKLSYKKFINEIGYQNKKTEDGVDFISPKLAYRELNYAIQGN